MHPIRKGYGNPASSTGNTQDSNPRQHGQVRGAQADRGRASSAVSPPTPPPISGSPMEAAPSALGATGGASSDSSRPSSPSSSPLPSPPTSSVWRIPRVQYHPKPESADAVAESSSASQSPDSSRSSSPLSSPLPSSPMSSGWKIPRAKYSPKPEDTGARAKSSSRPLPERWPRAHYTPGDTAAGTGAANTKDSDSSSRSTGKASSSQLVAKPSALLSPGKWAIPRAHYSPQAATADTDSSDSSSSDSSSSDSETSGSQSTLTPTPLLTPGMSWSMPRARYTPDQSDTSQTDGATGTGGGTTNIGPHQDKGKQKPGRKAVTFAGNLTEVFVYEKESSDTDSQ